jgi:hypothetical protein
MADVGIMMSFYYDDGPRDMAGDDVSEAAYQHFLTSVYSVLEGQIDASKFVAMGFMTIDLVQFV